MTAEDISNNDNSILFSVLIANFNNGQFLDDCIKSILNQSYQNWEIIFIDDASTDNSASIITKYNSDPRIRTFYNNNNLGCGFTKKKCIKFAKGQIFGFVDPDDALVTDAIEIMVYAHLKNIAHGLIYSTHYICDNNLKVIQVANYVSQIPKDKKSWHIKIPAISHFATFKMACYKRTAGLCGYYEIAQDKDIYFKMEDKCPVLYVDLPLYYYRHHSSNISLGANAEKAYKEELTARAMALLRNRKRKSIIDNSDLNLVELVNGVISVALKLLRSGYILFPLILVTKAILLNPSYFFHFTIRKLIKS